MRERTILATSGGYADHARLAYAFGPLVRHAVDLSGVHGRAPKVTTVGTACGDQRTQHADDAEAARAAGFDHTVLSLFPMPNLDDVEGHLLDQDVVWVHGGSVANLLAVWRAHGLDEVFGRVWRAGVVLAGCSAGSICWYQGGTTDSFGPTLRPVTDGLGLLPFGSGVHYDSEGQRRPLVRDLVEAGVFAEMHCTDDGVGLVYQGTTLVEAVTERPGQGASRVTRQPDGSVHEERIEARPI